MCCFPTAFVSEPTVESSKAVGSDFNEDRQPKTAMLPPKPFVNSNNKSAVCHFQSSITFNEHVTNVHA